MGVRRNQPMGLGVFVADRLAELGLTQRELADRTGISEGEVSRIVSADRVSPRGDTLLKLSRGLGVTVDALLTLGEEDGKRPTGMATPGKATKTTS